MNIPPRRFYRFAYTLAHFLFCLFFRFSVTGGENIPKGAVMVCANHTDWLDTVFLELAFGKDDLVHFLGKAEILKVPLLSWFARKLEMIPVDRSGGDVSAMRKSLQYLKNGEKVAIFPEGRRVSADGSAAAKNGAIWLAERAGVPILPLYITKKKRVFGRIELIVGQPYTIGETGRRLRADERSELSARLMSAIMELGPK
jgi:1-acyl-sn-glycerol-3-phosphate acyltransferase